MNYWGLRVPLSLGVWEKLPYFIVALPVHSIYNYFVGILFIVIAFVLCLINRKNHLNETILYGKHNI